MTISEKMFKLQDKITTLRLEEQRLKVKGDKHSLVLKSIDSEIFKIQQKILTLKEESMK